MSRQQDTICPNCFSDKMEGSICGQCKYDKAKAQTHALALPEFTILHGRYMVGRIIGTGGFGITYKAYDLAEHQIRAVKEYVPRGVVARKENHTTMIEVSGNQHEAFLHGKQRFYEEASVLYACRNIPQVVEIVDYFQENNTAYFVMEYINGVTLRKYVLGSGGKLPLEKSVKLIYDAGNALEQVHQKVGIFHRDISPENIMITVEGEVKIIDFGNAKNIDRGQLTVTLKMGFAPPEQYSSQTKQGRYTDVYSLAVTFYYMVTGVMVPESPKRLTGSAYTALADMNVGASPELSAVVDKALALNYRERYQTVGEFVNALCPTMRMSVPKENPVFTDTSRQENQSGKGYAEGAGFQAVPYMEITGGLMEGARWTFPPDEQVSVGRSSSRSDIVIEGSVEISRQHFLLEYDSGNEGFYIEDVSQNGIFVGGRQLARYVRYLLPLKSGRIPGIDSRYILPVGSSFTLGVNVCRIRLGVAYDRI